LLGIGVLGLLGLSSEAMAELTPREIAIIATSSPASKSIAEYYAERRGVPREQIMLLDAKPNVDLSRADWDARVRPAIRDWLKSNQLQGKIRCLVLAWDLPMRIGPAMDAAATIAARKSQLDRIRQTTLDRLADTLGTVDGLGRSPLLAITPNFDSGTTFAAVAEATEKTINAAANRLRSQSDREAQRQGFAAFEKSLVAVGGMEALANLVMRQGKPASAEVGQRVDALRRDLKKRQEELQAMLFELDTVERDKKLIEQLETVGGLVGVVRWIDEQKLALQKHETQASFDSELSILDWPPYPLSMWQINPLFYPIAGAMKDRPVMMVARLTAPRPDLVKKLIDDSIAVERTGLQGKCYIDARGLAYNAKRDTHGSYPEYDQSLRNLAERLRKNTKLDVVIDDKSALFAPGSCPDAALYCGWYSLGKYVDAFTWKPGAVAYHIASSEAVVLNQPGSKLWCPAMLERGVAATLGPAFEPYLAAFPLPDDFFSLLLTGRYSLIETYYHTSPFVSWAMIFVGDPLYNPFKAKPALDVSALPDRMKAAMVAPAAKPQ
jgi:uncharacterized protein (TIGR03790 family)